MPALNSWCKPIVNNSMNSHRSPRSSSSCMMILIILHHHFRVVDVANVTKFHIERYIRVSTMTGNVSHAFVVNFEAAIYAAPIPPLVPYHGRGLRVQNINSSLASRNTNAFACVPDTMVRFALLCEMVRYAHGERIGKISSGFPSVHEW